MKRPIHPDCPQPRRSIGGIGLLVVVALALSTGLSGGEWARLAGSHRETTPTPARQSGAIVHAVQRAERRQTHKPTLTALIAPLAGDTAADRVNFGDGHEPGTTPRRLRAALLSLPPPARV